MIEAREIKQLVCNEGELTALCTDSTVWHRKWLDDGDGTAYEWVQGPGMPHREVTAEWIKDKILERGKTDEDRS